MKPGDRIVVRDTRLNRWHEGTVVYVPPPYGPTPVYRVDRGPYIANFRAEVKLDNVHRTVFLGKKMKTLPPPRYVRTRAKRP